jgi:hypothetical protein
MSTERRKGCGKRNQGKGIKARTHIPRARARREREGLLAGRAAAAAAAAAATQKRSSCCCSPSHRYGAISLRPSTPKANAAAPRRQRVSGSEAEGQREVATAIDELFARAGFLVGGVGTQKKGNGFVSGEFSGLDMAGAPRR